MANSETDGLIFMFMKKILLLSCVLLFQSCGSRLKTPDGDTIDLSQYKTWPDSLVLETYHGGGMVPEWKRVYISKDSCYSINARMQTQNKYNFKLSQSELNDLLTTLKDYRVEKLGVKKLNYVVYDAPSTSLTVRLGGKSVNISNGATEEISEAQEGDFRNCYGIIQRVAAGKIMGEKRNCCFVLDKSLALPGKVLSIIPEGADSSYTDSTTQLKDKVCFSFLKGKYAFQVHITQRGKVNYTDYFASVYPEFFLSKDTSLTIRLKSDSVLVVE
jgi:hypothetical protein